MTERAIFFGRRLINLSSLSIQNLAYDANGNSLRPGFVHDEFGQLVYTNEFKSWFWATRKLAEFAYRK